MWTIFSRLFDFFEQSGKIFARTDALSADQAPLFQFSIASFSSITDEWLPAVMSQLVQHASNIDARIYLPAATAIRPGNGTISAYVDVDEELEHFLAPLLRGEKVGIVKGMGKRSSHSKQLELSLQKATNEAKKYALRAIEAERELEKAKKELDLSNGLLKKERDARKIDEAHLNELDATIDELQYRLRTKGQSPEKLPDPSLDDRFEGLQIEPGRTDKRSDKRKIRGFSISENLLLLASILLVVTLFLIALFLMNKAKTSNHTSPEYVHTPEKPPVPASASNTRIFEADPEDNAPPVIAASISASLSASASNSAAEDNNIIREYDGPVFFRHVVSVKSKTGSEDKGQEEKKEITQLQVSEKFLIFLVKQEAGQRIGIFNEKIYQLAGVDKAAFKKCLGTDPADLGKQINKENTGKFPDLLIAPNFSQKTKIILRSKLSSKEMESCKKLS
ncbi:hypothetical protein [Undibacterium pigrum]|uniref:hypothetical protein n=1 Tax=Undibacterium pigrum TaxID=401470 RepID=UPI0011B44446|nr:hypothetical protein [Undibacterium pigrum]